MMRQDTIHINDLSIGYRTKNDTKLVASHIQARIYSGELTCLLGANGVGKSTLLRTLSAFQPKLGGEIAVLGRDMDSYSDKELSTTIGVVLTEKCDIRNMSVRELVEMGRSPYTGFWGRLDKEDKQVVEESIALVRIENLASRMVHTLSDGERQKVMIAKVLAQETPVIFLDEPTAFLDFPSKVEIMPIAPPSDAKHEQDDFPLHARSRTGAPDRRQDLADGPDERDYDRYARRPRPERPLERFLRPQGNRVRHGDRLVPHR